MAAFYLFYKMLLSGETFHRFNRFALLGILVGAFVLPTISIQSHIQQETNNVLIDFGSMMVEPLDMIESNVEENSFHWASVLLLIYLLGVVCFWAKHLYAVGSLIQQIRTGKKVRREDGNILVLYKKDIAPFSWMHYIIISEKDMNENGEIIIRHETAHIRNCHSWDLVVADLCISLQWFNPAVWLVKSELQNVHEFEADESVINQGIDAKRYQLLLIEKAVGARLYSMANSFNHGTLKKRITMMVKKKSNPCARLKYLYVLPLATIAVTAFSRPEISSELDEISNAEVSDLTAIMNTDMSKNDVIDQKNAIVKSPVINIEAIRASATLPKRAPSTQRGKSVNVKFVNPITFDLKTTEKKTEHENKLSQQILSNEKNGGLDREKQTVNTSNTASNTLKSPIIIVDNKVVGNGIDVETVMDPDDVESIVVFKSHEQITKFVSQENPLQLSKTEIQKFKKLYDKEKNNGVLFITMKN